MSVNLSLFRGRLSQRKKDFLSYLFEGSVFLHVNMGL